MNNILIDTHAHLYSEQFDTDRADMVRRAMAAGVGRMYLPNVDSQTIPAMLDLERTFSGRCVAAMGLHPCSVQSATYQHELAVVERWLGERPFCAIGEIGIDLYWDKTTLDEQIVAFERQIAWAKELDIPILIHARESLDIIIPIIRAAKTARLHGVFHCFTGTREQAQAIMDIGDFYMGIGGVLTYKKSGLDAVLNTVPMEYLVLETDAPYLPPTPHRGKRNESGYIVEVAHALARTKNSSYEEVAQQTTQNALDLFRASADDIAL